MYLIDSDCLINFLNGQPQAVKVISHLQNHLLYTCIINIGEIMLGLQDPTAKNKSRKSKFEAFLQTLTVINIDQPVIEKFINIKYHLKKRGQLVDNFDLLIAAACLAHKLILVTDNHSHFQNIPNLKLYPNK